MADRKRHNKPGAGRPRKPEPTKNLNFRIEYDLLIWLDYSKGDKSRNQFINDIIRKCKNSV